MNLLFKVFNQYGLTDPLTMLELTEPCDSEYPEDTIFLPFIGITNKFDQKLFLGDIVSKTMFDGSVHTCVIRYSERHARFGFCPVSETFDLERDVVPNPNERLTYKVIGNMYTNPELVAQN